MNCHGLVNGEADFNLIKSLSSSGAGSGKKIFIECGVESFAKFLNFV